MFFTPSPINVSCLLGILFLILTYDLIVKGGGGEGEEDNNTRDLGFCAHPAFRLSLFLFCFVVLSSLRDNSSPVGLLVSRSLVFVSSGYLDLLKRKERRKEGEDRTLLQTRKTSQSSIAHLKREIPLPLIKLSRLLKTRLPSFLHLPLKARVRKKKGARQDGGGKEGGHIAQKVKLYVYRVHEVALGSRPQFAGKKRKKRRLRLPENEGRTGDGPT